MQVQQEENIGYREVSVDGNTTSKDKFLLKSSKKKNPFNNKWMIPMTNMTSLSDLNEFARLFAYHVSIVNPYTVR